MDKIILKDETIIEIEESSNGVGFRKIFTDPRDYVTILDKLTTENLSAYQVQNDVGLVCSNPVNKECLTQNVTTLWSADGILDGLDVTFNITDVDMLAKAVRDLQVGQQTQDGAITDLGETVGKLAEGGMQ